jgi:hypothetical protein
MSKRRSKPPAVRLSAEGARAVAQLANGAGWPFNKALAFIVRAGWNALNSGSDEIPALRQVMANAVLHQETKRAMEKRLAVTARKLRDAQSALAGRKGGGP